MTAVLAAAVSLRSELLGYAFQAGIVLIGLGIGAIVERRNTDRRVREIRHRTLQSLDHSRRWSAR